jgi:hypothetical protein
MLGSRSIGCWINGNRKSFIGPVLLTFPFVYVGVTLIVAVIGKTLDLSFVKASISLAPEVASPIDEVLVHE